MNLSSLIQTITVLALPLIFAITLHEAGHAYAAKFFGDPTAWLAGRVSLNPIRHIDPMGTIVVPLLMLAASAASGGGGFLFGWAKPVPVNFGGLRHPKRDMVWVAAAGPGCNLLQAIGWAILLKILLMAGVHETFFLQMCLWGININIFLMAFNLIPIPPLDGGRVAVGLLPWSVGQYLQRLEPYGMWIVIALAFAGGTDLLIGPLVRFGQAIASFVITL